MKPIYLILLLISCCFTALSQEEDPTETVPDTVKAGAYIINIHDINFRDKEYTIRFWLWMLYDNPSFDFATQIDIPNAKDIETPVPLMDLVDGKTWQLMKMKCTMKQNWNVDDFPFDKQHLMVRVENSVYDNKTLVYELDKSGSTYDRELTIDGWNISNFEVNTSVNEYTTVFGDPNNDALHSEYASFNISMDIERDAWGLFAKIFIGMYIAFLISIISFALRPSELEPRFGLPVGGLFAAVGNKYIIDSLLPESTNFTLVDTLHTITFLGILATLLVSAISLKYFDNGQPDKSEKVNRIGSILVVSVYVIANILLVSLAIL
ncbi:MAG: hypothetical protein EBR30_13105 [Cytophagia bacterium]|nr:hypothetical protein [Cytophagia bacterium]